VSRGVIADMRLVGAQETMVRVVGTVMGKIRVAWVVGSRARWPTGCFVLMFLSTTIASGI